MTRKRISHEQKKADSELRDDSEGTRPRPSRCHHGVPKAAAARRGRALLSRRTRVARRGREPSAPALQQGKALLMGTLVPTGAPARLGPR